MDVLGIAFSEFTDAERMTEEIMDDRETSARAIAGAPDPGKGNHNGKLGLMKSPNLADRPEQALEKLRFLVALIDPKALTRGPIGELLAKAFPEYALVTASTCEELLETEGIGRTNLVVVYIRSAVLPNTWVQSALELLRGASRRPRPLCFLTGTMLRKSTAR
jgi:hypothetical protein